MYESHLWVRGNAQCTIYTCMKSPSAAQYRVNEHKQQNQK